MDETAKQRVGMWANSVFELRDAYRAFRQVIAEHPDRENLVRRYEEVMAQMARERLGRDDLPTRP